MIPTCLSSILAPRTIAEFVETTFGRRLGIFSGRKVGGSFGVEDFEELLWSQEGALPAHLVVYTLAGEGWPPRRRQNKDLFRWAVEQYHEGCTLRFENVHKVLPSVARLAGDCAQQLLSRVAADIILMPSVSAPRVYGLPREADLFVIQTFGTSLWDLDEHVSRDLNGVPHSDRSGRVQLRQGDSLYLPSLYFRTAKSLDQCSVCLVLRMQSLTEVDLLESLIEVSTELDVELRFSVSQRRDTLATTYARALEKLLAHARSVDVRRLAWERLLLRLADEHRVASGGHMVASHRAQQLTTEDLVQVRAGAILVMTDIPSGLFVYVPGLGGVSERESQPGGLIFPSHARVLLTEIANSRGRFCARELPESYSLRARLATVRQLVSAGALEPVDNDASDGIGAANE